MSTPPLAPKACHITKHEAWVCCAFCLQHLANKSPKELKEDIHALSMQTMTPGEWTARGGQVMASPECLGGSKHDK